MSNTATVTAKTGPGIQATALPLSGITEIKFDLNAGVLFLSDGNGQVNQFELTGSNTITLTATAGVYALTVS